MPSKLYKAIAAVKDQTSISLAKVSNHSSSNLEVAVLKATTHDSLPIDDKYIYEVLYIVSSNKVHAAACARAIGKRIGRTRNWVVALKSLMLVLRIFQDGDPYFPREILHAMKRGAKILNLSSFRDDSNSSPWDFTAFVRTFAMYLDERLECFLTGKLQRRYTHDDRETGYYERSKSRGSRRVTEPVRDMKPAMLLDKMSYWQRLLERAIATRPTGAAKKNRLVLISFYAIVQESFELYKDISEGVTLLLDSFFHLQYQNCVSAFQACVKASKQFEELTAFYAMCKSLGVGRSSEYPSINKISEELIETLQEFLKDQSSFTSDSNHSKTTRNLLLPGPRSNRHNSLGGKPDARNGHRLRSSDVGTQCTSLEELISATETEMANQPAISIDLDAYPAPKPDDAFRIGHIESIRSLPVTNSVSDIMLIGDWTMEHKPPAISIDLETYPASQPAEDSFGINNCETASAKSLPVSNSMVDVMSIGDWPWEQDQKIKEENGILESSGSKNWELELAQAVSTMSTSNSLQSLSDSTPNGIEENQPAATTGWELVLLDAPAAPEENQLPLTLPSSNHYNPFLQDELPEVSNTPLPTFQAVPTFSAQNPNTNLFPTHSQEDPFSVQNVNTSLFPVHNQNDTFSAQNSSTDSFSVHSQNDPFSAQNSSTDPFSVHSQNDPFSAQNSSTDSFSVHSQNDPFSAQNSSTGHSQNDPFSAQNSNTNLFPVHSQNDPFADLFSGEKALSSQENFLQEQQLWLKNQSKIISKQTYGVDCEI